MADFSSGEIARLEQAGRLLLKAEKRLPVLSRLKWDRTLADTFFASGDANRQRLNICPSRRTPRLS